MSYLGVGVSPGNVPVYHGSSLKVFDKRVRLAELVLRCVICALALVGALLIATDTQVLVVSNGILAAYSLVQVVRCTVSIIRGSVLFNKPLAWAVFSGDQLMAYLSLAAVAAATQSAVIAKFGQNELQWMKICNMYGKFCNQVAEGIASSLFASISLVLLSGLSAFSLFRLYGENKSKCNGR